MIKLNVRLLCLSLMSVLFFGGCQKPVPEKTFWIGQLHRSDGKNIPFRTFVDLQSTPPSGYFLVGDERTPIPEIQRRGDSLIFVFSEYNAAMRGTLNGDRWQGNYIRYRTMPIAVPFSAVAEVQRQSDSLSPATPAIPLVGKYRAFLSDGGQTDSSTVATFWAKHDTIYGTLIAPDGDYGLNVGVQRGTAVSLSRFTGWQAQLFEFNQAGSSWTGTFCVRNEPPERLTLDPVFTLNEPEPAGKETSVRNPGIPFAFSGVTANGDTLTNESPRFHGKALIVDIMGTWCHNCMDEAPVLQRLYEDYRSKGLEIVGLSFEINNDFNQARTNLQLYQKRYGLTFPLLFCGSTDNKFVDPQLNSQLKDFYAYPTAICIGKTGRVQYIHVGFKGPGTGEEFQSEVNHLYTVVRRLVGS